MGRDVGQEQVLSLHLDDRLLGPRLLLLGGELREVGGVLGERRARLLLLGSDARNQLLARRRDLVDLHIPLDRGSDGVRRDDVGEHRLRATALVRLADVRSEVSPVCSELRIDCAQDRAVRGDGCVEGADLRVEHGEVGVRRRECGPREGEGGVSVVGGVLRVLRVLRGRGSCLLSCGGARGGWPRGDRRGEQSERQRDRQRQSEPVMGERKTGETHRGQSPIG